MVGYTRRKKKKREAWEILENLRNKNKKIKEKPFKFVRDKYHKHKIKRNQVRGSENKWI